MSRRRKRELTKLLEQRDRQGLIEWTRSVRTPLRLLFSLTYSDDELIRWRAIEGIGIAAREVAARNLEKVRVFLRGLLWLMNDESGGVGWRAPETMAEVLVQCPELVGEFGGLLPQFLVEEPFEAGTHYALYRLRQVAPELILSSVRELEVSLGDPDPAVRGYAWLSLRHVGSKTASSRLDAFAKDSGKLTIFDFESGELRECQISAIVRADTTQ